MAVINIRLDGLDKDNQGQYKSTSPPEALLSRGPRIWGVLTYSDTQFNLRTSLEDTKDSSVTGWILFDTGASCSCFDIKAADTLDLAVVDKTYVNSVTHGKQLSPVYSGKLIVEKLSIPIQKSAGVNLAPHGLIALIGRDVMQNGVLIYNGTDGSFTFCLENLRS